jgi:hypothetical protein
MADDQSQEAKARRDALARYQEKANEVISSWPAWKQSSLGPPPIGAPSQLRESSDRKRR